MHACWILLNFSLPANLDCRAVAVDGVLQPCCFLLQCLLTRQRKASSGGGYDRAWRHETTKQHQLFLHLPQPPAGLSTLRKLAIQDLRMHVVACALYVAVATGAGLAALPMGRRNSSNGRSTAGGERRSSTANRQKGARAAANSGLSDMPHTQSIFWAVEIRRRCARAPFGTASLCCTAPALAPTNPSELSQFAAAALQHLAAAQAHRCRHHHLSAVGGATHTITMVMMRMQD